MSPVLKHDMLSFGAKEAGGLIAWQQHFQLDERTISSGLGTHLDPVAADLLDVAVAAYVGDRICPRRPEGARSNGEWWRRSIPMRLALREPARWNESGAAATLHELLSWLTDDEWRIELVGGSPARPTPPQDSLFADLLADPVDVALFSGGLDSLLGADLDARQHGDLILVAAGTNGRMIGLQRDLARGLATVGPRRVRLLSTPVFLTAAGKTRLGRRGESSQRSRGLVFAALGAAVAHTVGAPALRIHENGPGALNLPLTPGQFGSMNTRAARPETLLLLGRMLTQLFGAPFEVVNPAFWKTKAQMVRNARPEIDPLILASVSCDSGLTRRVAKGQLCGTCTSCLLRRQALLAARRVDLDVSDLRRMEGDSLKGLRDHANPMVLAMLSQAADLAGALGSADPWSALVDLFPECGSARRALDARPADLIGLFERYVSDWRQVPRPLVRDLVPV
jgi:hypothetical protein